MRIQNLTHEGSEKVWEFKELNPGDIFRLGPPEKPGAVDSDCVTEYFMKSGGAAVSLRSGNPRHVGPKDFVVLVNHRLLVYDY